MSVVDCVVSTADEHEALLIVLARICPLVHQWYDGDGTG
jgi:hypothetical protein